MFNNLKKKVIFKCLVITRQLIDVKRVQICNTRSIGMVCFILGTSRLGDDGWGNQ